MKVAYLFTVARKAGVALVGLAAAALAQGYLPDQYARWAAVVVAAGTALGVHQVPNDTPEQQP